MATINDLEPKSRLKVLSEHPDFHTYTPEQQERAVGQRMFKDKKAAQRKAGRQAVAPVVAEAKQAEQSKVADVEGNVSTKPPTLVEGGRVDTSGWVSPTIGHHTEMQAAADKLRDTIDAREGQRNYGAVRAHLDNADAHLDSHLAAHTTDQAPLAAAYLSTAGEHITKAYRAMDAIHSGSAAPQGDSVEKWTKAKSVNYTDNFAPGSKMPTPAPMKFATGTNVEASKSRSRADKEASAARTAEKAQAQAEQEAKVQRVPTREEWAAKQATADKLVKKIVSEVPESPSAPRVGLGPKERAAARAKVQAKQEAWSVRGGSAVDLSGKIAEGAREHVAHHAKIAFDSLKAGQKIPSNSAQILGPAGIKAVRAAHSNWQDTQVEEPADNTGLFEGIVKPSRTGSFNSGRGA
ncbi:hypothetical protein UFOVP46_70 [uncultured Caudovirales phage]|uniref:Uncharacterized protein n=1 Tax=uncultured Caudovirales phage TaxID=2100421 RepID=A0A6J5KQT5_9CAUD|nr:hypothetical protein UFOVP46_70 [uncultured Caudovirales phage]